MRRVGALLLVVAAATAGYKDGGADTPDPTVPTSAAESSSSTTAVADIATIPEVIDEPYLNRVLAALDKVDTSAVREVMETKSLPPKAAEIFNSIYADEWFSIKVDSWLDQLQQDPDLSGLKRPLGDRRTTVERLITSSPSCVFVAVKRDYTASDVSPPPPRTEYLILRPLDATNDPKHHNPTAWMITADGTRKDGSQPDNPCLAG